MRRTLARGATALALTLAISACHSGSDGGRSAVSHPSVASTTSSTTSSTTTTTTTTTTSTTVAPTTAAPSTTRAPAPTTTAAVGPPFTGTIGTVTAAQLGGSYRAGCPVGPAALRLLHLSYWGFDHAPHVGTMVVNAAVATAVVGAFARLFHERFPIRQMRPVSAYGGSDDASMAADNTSGFNCRYVANTKHWSVHAYGEAIDVNTVENPYLVDGHVEPPAAAAYLDRANLRPGMAAAGTVINDAFAAIGWYWGGRFHSPDYQHFSKTGG